MSILVIFSGNVSKAQYESLRSEVNWERQKPYGGIFHCASFDDSDSIHVADVWESMEAMGEFVDHRLAPAMERLQITPPEIAIYPAYNINAYPSVDAYKI